MDSTTLYNKYNELYNTDPFISDTVECDNFLTNAIALGRRKKRQELIESTDVIHSSRRAGKLFVSMETTTQKQKPSL